MNEQIIPSIEYEYQSDNIYAHVPPNIHNVSLLEYGLLKLFNNSGKEESLRRILFLGQNGKTFSDDIQEHVNGTIYLYAFLISFFIKGPMITYKKKPAVDLLELLAECKDAITGLIPQGTLITPMSQLDLFEDVEDMLHSLEIDEEKTLTTSMVVSFSDDDKLKKRFQDEKKKQLKEFFTVLKERFDVNFNLPDGHDKSPFDYVSEVVKKNKDVLDEDHAHYRENVEFLVATLFQSGMKSSSAYASLTEGDDSSTTPGFMFLCDLIARFGTEPTEEEKRKILKVPIPLNCERIHSFRERVRGYACDKPSGS